jgi:predicted SprT family Zn-dependent metalloprotease
MTKTELATYATMLLREWGCLSLKGWKFGWNNRKQALGLCRIREKRIELSAFLFDLVTEDEIKDTVKHELAHALDAEERGYSDHGPNWQRWAIRVGARPVRCSKTPEDKMHEARKKETAKWMLRCPNGHVEYAYRRTNTRSSCGKCCPGRFNEAFLNEWVPNR